MGNPNQKLEGGLAAEDEELQEGEEGRKKDEPADNPLEKFVALVNTVEKQKPQPEDKVAEAKAGPAPKIEPAKDLKDQKDQKDQKEDKPDAKEAKREVIELAKLPLEKQQDIENIRDLQGLLVRFADKLQFGSEQERERFFAKLQNEFGEKMPGEQDKFFKVPEFGEASKEGFKKLKDLLEKGAVPDLLGALDKQLLEIPPGFPLKVAGKEEPILKSSERLRQDVAQGKTYLDVDPTKLSDVSKLSKVTNWMGAADKLLHDDYVNRLEKYLTSKVEEGIKSGNFPEGWRRPEGMDKETWCSSVEQAMNAYTRTTRVIEALNYLEKSGTGFKSDALKDLPPGVKVERDPSGKITNVDYSRYMIQDLSLLSDANRQKLEPLSAWCDKYEGKAQQGLSEALKNRNHVPGFGEYELHGAWVNPKTGQWTMGEEKEPGSDWQKINLLSYDMDIKEERDAFGKVSKVFVSSDVAFQEVPPFGYLNTFAQDKHRVKSDKPVEYNPDDYVAVQTGPGSIEMVQAKNLADWKLRQQIKHYGEKAITLTMDAAMIASGVGEIRAATKVAEIGAKRAIGIGAKVMQTEAVTQIPKGLAASMVRKGIFEIGLGVTGVFHNAGAHEVPWMKAVSDLRTAYFLGHATYSLASWARMPQGAKGLAEMVSPSATNSVERLVKSLHGSEDFLKAQELAKMGGLRKAGLSWLAADKGVHAAFSVSEKAFIGMFLWDTVGMAQHFSEPYRRGAIDAADKAMQDARLADRDSLAKLIAAGNRPSERAENYMRGFAQTLPLDDKAKKECDAIIARAKELSAPDAKAEDKQKFVQDMMKYFRYDGAKISGLQDRRFQGNQLSEADLTAKAQADKELDPSVKKMAAMAILSLARKSDGSWDETLTNRTVTVPEFTELIQGENMVIEHKVGPLSIEQKLGAAELVNLLKDDLRAETESGKRTDKAASLHEIGLVSSAQYGDLLLSRIEGKQGLSKEDRLRAVSDLAGLVSRLKVEEKILDGKLNRSESYAAKGLTAGLDSKSLMSRLEKSALESDDKDVKATALLSLALLRKEELDKSDQERLQKFFLKEPPGITEAEFEKLLSADAASKPTDKAGWERKLIASEMLLRKSLLDGEGKIDKAQVEHLRDCLKNNKEPEIAARSLDALVKADRLGGSPLAALEQAEPGESWRNKIVIDAMNNLNMPQGDLDIPKQIEAARARLKFIENLTGLVNEGSDKVLKRQLVGSLRARADISFEPVQELRAAAVKAIGELGIKDKEQLDLLKRALSPKVESSPAVRLAAVDAVERLVARNKERRELLAPLAVSEPDPAVRERLARYYDPTGSIRDRNSQRARQEVNDAVTEQNKQEFKSEDIDRMVFSRHPRLAGGAKAGGHPNIFRYIDANNEYHRAFPFMQDEHTSIGRVWDSSIETINSFWTQGFVKDIARDNLIKFEAKAQDRAVSAFDRGVQDLYKAAMSGGLDLKVKVGEKTVSERDAAVLALANLVSKGSRMGEAFYRHRDTYDRNPDVEPGLGDFNSRQNRQRSEYARDQNFNLYSSDPWLASERKIAEKLRDLCSQSSDKVNLSLLKDEMLRALASDAKTSDASRKTLVDGLDRLLSNPHMAPESRRDILKKVGELVRTSKEVEKDKSGSITDMVRLLDKHGKGAFETFSDAYATMRTGVASRGENDKMPPHLRLRAQEMFDRQWGSVLAEQDRIAAQPGTAIAKAELLPKNFEALEKEKEGKQDGFDEDVHDAVQRIIMATKGHPLSPDDPRLDTLQKLTEDKYDDRVRLAAYSALVQYGTGQFGLVDLVMKSKDRAVRHDAAALLAKGKPFAESEGSVEGLRSDVLSKLAEVQGKSADDMLGKSAADMIKEANDFIDKNIKSNDARQKARAQELQEAMHRYGEGLAVIANLKARYQPDKSEAERLFKLAISAFGINDSDLEKLKGAAAANGNAHSAESKQVKEVSSKLLESLQHTGATPALLSVLNGYDKFLIDKIKKVEDIAPNLGQAIGIASLSDNLAKIYYPEGSLGRAESLKASGQFYQRIGQVLTNKDKWYPTAIEFMDESKKNLEAYKSFAGAQIAVSKESMLKSANEDLAVLQQLRVDARMEHAQGLTSRADFKPKSYIRWQVQEMSKELEKELQAIPDKSSTQFKFERFYKDRLDVKLADDDKRAEAITKAEGSLDAAMSAFAAKFGTASPQYSSMLAQMWRFHAGLNQADKAEAFFKNALAQNKGQEQVESRKVMLNQYYQFLKDRKRDADANEVAKEYRSLN